MVFSQTSHKTQSILKVVELDRLKPDKNQQVNGLTGVVTNGNLEAMPSSPVATTSFSEEYLKPEPLFETTMFHDTDSEFFQDLVQWCSAPAKEEQALTIDSPKLTEERAHNYDTQHKAFSPQGWDVFDTNSPYAQAGFYNNTTPTDPLSPTLDSFPRFEDKYMTLPENENKFHFQEKFLDLSSLPVVLGDLASDKVPEPIPWTNTESGVWANTHDTSYTRLYPNTQYTMPFIDEDSLDTKLVSVIPRELESNNVVVSEYVLHGDHGKSGVLQETGHHRRVEGLSLDVVARAPNWPNNNISTPEVLSYVEQLEREKCTRTVLKPNRQRLPPDMQTDASNTSTKTTTPPPVDYEPVTPKSESHPESDIDDLKSHSFKRKHDSEDSDETYTPHTEHTTRKYNKRRKPNVPIKDMIIALQGSQQLPKARRGRPPKRRESTVSSVCSVDDNASNASTQGMKYRELRDKNNEASKRSRMNRKLKELEMEQLAVDLEEKNKKLKVRADILEDMTKKLKEALMTAILQK